MFFLLYLKNENSTIVLFSRTGGEVRFSSYDSPQTEDVLRCGIKGMETDGFENET